MKKKKENEKMKSKKLAIGLLVMLALVVTTGTFAFWASGLAQAEATASGTVTIGEGEEEAATVTLGAVTATGSALIPTSQGTAGTDDTAEFEIPVSWSQNDGTEFAGVSGTLVVTVEYSLSNSTLTSAELDDMFSFSVDVTSLTEGASAVPVTVTVVFDTEPANQTIYEDVINEILTVNITFTVNAD